MIIVNVSIYIMYGIALFLTRTYEKKTIITLDKKEHPLTILYPLCLFLLDHFLVFKKLKKSRTKVDTLRALNVGDDIEKVNRFYITKKVAVALLIIIAFNTISLFMFLSEKKQDTLVGGNTILRPSYGEDEEEVTLDVMVEDGNDCIESDITFKVNPKHYDSTMAQEMIEKAQTYIDKQLLGENTSYNEIDKPLNLIKNIPGTGFSVKWDMDEYNIIEKNGNLNNSDIDKNGVLTSITAKVKYYETTFEYTIPLKIMPKVTSNKEQVLSDLGTLVNKSEGETLTKNEVKLPDQVGDRKLIFSQKKRQSPGLYLVFGVFLSIIIVVMMDQDLEKKLQKREIELLIDYPEIVNKFSLLLGAGMTMKNAWGKIVSEYNGKNKCRKGVKRYAYEEMSITWNEMMNGITETKAFENFGRRVKLLPYLKFSSLLSQNVKKGMKGLLDLLEIEAMDAFEDRKELAKRLGEEASTKLLGPMILMLLIVLLIIMVPAFLTM